MKVIIVLTALITHYCTANSTNVDIKVAEAADEKKYNVKVLEKCILDFYNNPDKSKGQKLIDDLGSFNVGLYRFMRKMKEGDKRVTQEGIEYFNNGMPEFMKRPINEKEFKEMMGCTDYESQHYRYLRKDIELGWEHLQEHIEDLKSTTTEGVTTV